MTIKAILFDLDDTLWPVGPVIRHAEQALHDWLAVHTPQVTAAYDIEGLRRRRQALVPTDLRFSYDLWSLRHRLLQDVMAEQGADPAHADAAMQVFAQARNQVSLYDDVLPALQQLQADFITGSVSNGFADLNSIGLAPYFRVSMAAHSFGCAKPDPRIFLAACEALQVAPHETLYVGDDVLLDVHGATQAGLQAVWMNRHGISADKPEWQHVTIPAQIRDLHDLRQRLTRV